jgi:hypothetical protein
MRKKVIAVSRIPAPRMERGRNPSQRLSAAFFVESLSSRAVWDNTRTPHCRSNGACGGRTDGGTDRRGSRHAGTPVSPAISIATVIAIVAPVGVAVIDAAGASSKRQSFSGQ